MMKISKCDNTQFTETIPTVKDQVPTHVHLSDNFIETQKKTTGKSHLVNHKFIIFFV